MRLLHVTDLHFRPHWYEWVKAQAAAFDAVCLSGDFLDMFGIDETRYPDQIRWVRGWIRTFPGRLFACSGNHDWWVAAHGIRDNDERGGWLRKMSTPSIAVDGSRRDFLGAQFACLPWLGVPPGYAMERPTIFVAHCPPAGTLTAQSAGHADSEASPDWLSKVSGWYLTGHIHGPARWWDRKGGLLVLNPGCDFKAEIPNHIVLDFGAGRASHFVRGELADSISIGKSPVSPPAPGSDPA